MNCRDADLNQLAAQEESSAEYLQCIAHLDQCPHCQSQMEQRLAADAISRELSLTLQSAALEDLEFTPSVDSHSLEFEYEADDDEHSQDQHADIHDLDFLQPATHPELLGRLGRYDIERIIGYGGMGVVFRAFDSELHRVVALKVLGKHLTTTAAARQRFAREARAAAAVLHPNVLPIHDVEAVGPTPYLVMQYIYIGLFAADTHRSRWSAGPLGCHADRQTNQRGIGSSSSARSDSSRRKAREHLAGRGDRSSCLGRFRPGTNCRRRLADSHGHCRWNAPLHVARAG
jgi:serine/threonine protein kinase